MSELNQLSLVLFEAERGGNFTGSLRIFSHEPDRSEPGNLTKEPNLSGSQSKARGLGVAQVQRDETEVWFHLDVRGPWWRLTCDTG